MQWKTAWEKAAGNKGNMEKYMSFYSEEFKSEGYNKKTWRIDKESKNKRKAWIRITISNLKISSPSKNGHIEIRFNMSYKSSNFSGTSRKVLELVKELDSLKIVSERTY